MNSPRNSRSSEHFSCLLVDDDAGLAAMFAKIISEEGGQPLACHTIAAAREQIGLRSFDLIILDNRLPDGTGYEFYAQVVRRCPNAVVTMITGAPELSQAVELTRNGLFDYLTKPASVEDFTALVRRAKLRLRQPEAEPPADVMLGNTPVMRDVLQQLQQAAIHPNATVLLLGETGTGKDLAARVLHRLTYSERNAKAPYVPVNCPNIPAEMFEAELFGSEKGAYTGADRRRTGLVEAAQGGTLFLDEVAEIPLPIQSKLLRFLESGEYRPLGAVGMNRFLGRVVAATNRSLEEEVRASRFREDLLYRVDVFTVRLPPLRERLEDLDGLAEVLLTQLCEKYGRTVPLLKPPDLQKLRGHRLPGNVRELRNLLERSLLRTDPAAEYLAMDLSWLKGHVDAPASTSHQSPPPVHSRPQRQLSAIEQQEYELIAKTLQEEKGGIRRAAGKLGLTHQALLRRLQKWPELRQAAEGLPET